MNIHKISKPESQSGIALISVMGAIAVITSIIAALSYRQYVDIGIQSYAIQKNAAIIHVLSVENLASVILQDPQNNPSYDYYDEFWAEEVVDIDLDGPTASMIIFDAQAKFNANNINVNNANRNHVIAIMKNVFGSLDLDDGSKYEEFTQWLIPGDAPNEDRRYLADSGELFARYRTSDAPMMSANEIMLLTSFREEEDLQDIVYSFDDYLSFLPTIDELVKLNVNTASTEMMIEILKYFESEEQLEMIEAIRPFENINSFCAFIRDKIELCPAFFDVRSSYFYVIAKIDMGLNSVYSKSLIRTDGPAPINVITREIRFI